MHIRQLVPIGSQVLTCFFSHLSPLAISLFCQPTFGIPLYDCATRLAPLESCSGLVYDRSTALSLKMLMLLAWSRRRGRCLCRRVDLEPRPACPYLLLLSSHKATSQYREALLYLCSWEDGAGGWKKKKKPVKMLMCTSPNRVRRKGKKGKAAMSLTLLYTPHYALAAQSLVTSTLAAVEPPAT